MLNSGLENISRTA